MRNMFIIWRREFMAYFISPVAYVTITLFMVMTGWTFMQVLEENAGLDDPVTVLFFVSLFFWIPILVTVVSMRLFAEEKRVGTMEALMTAPVTETAVVMGKYAGALTFLLVVTSLSLIDLFLVVKLSPGIESLDMGAVVGGCIIVVLALGLCGAIGMFISLLTQNQIVAAIACFSAICFPFFARNLASFLPLLSDTVVEYVSIEAHIVDFARGFVSLQTLVLYLTGTVFCLFASIRLLESRRWCGG